MSRIVAPIQPFPRRERVALRADNGLPSAHRPRLAQNRVIGDHGAATIGGNASGCLVRSRALPSTPALRPFLHREHGARVATPGQAGLPAEFKHINKRRKRNLPGFP